MAFVIDRSLYLSPEVVGEPRRSAPLEVKEDPFSLEALVAWLERQDPETQYDYCNSSTCLMGRYVVSSGGQVSYGGDGGHYRIGDCLAMLKDFSTGDSPLKPVIRPYPQTFGAAKDRARKLLAEREK